MILFITNSAMNSTLTSNVYTTAGSKWNNISSNVHVSITFVGQYGGDSSIGYFVVGDYYYDGTIGETIPFDSNGNIASANSNWYRVTIKMNISSSTYSNADNPTNAAMKTFTHEIGHALKLSHPITNYNLSGHDYGAGVPKAVMNSGFPEETYIPYLPADHDKNNLKSKWGV
jgi:hypothetical protein